MGVARRAGWAAGLLVLAACSAPTTTGSATLTPSAAAVSTSTQSSDAVQAGSEPAHVIYPHVGVDADTHPTGLNPDGTVHVSALDHADEVDFIDFAPAFGKGRPIVLVAHRNGRYPNGSVMPGAFGRLPQATVGDLVTLTSASGAEARYKVTSVRSVLKAQFPASIYSPSPTPTLVLITCTGQLIDHDYQSNTLVSARLDGSST